MCKETSEQYQEALHTIARQERDIRKLQESCELIQAELEAERAEAAQSIGVVVA